MSKKTKSSGKANPSTGAFVSFSDVTSSTQFSSGSHKSKEIHTKDSRSRDFGSSFLNLQPVYTGQDSELLVISKKLTKKDSVTKQKALYELASLLGGDSEEKDFATIAGFLPFFVFVYQRLLLDNDRSIRELVNISLVRLMESLVRFEPKAFNYLVQALSPYMKLMVGYLWNATADPCKEVAVAASNAFSRWLDARPRALVVLAPCILRHATSMLSQSPESLAEIYCPGQAMTALLLLQMLRLLFLYISISS
jgi:hypothetical protein